MCSKNVVYLAGGMEKAGPHGALWREEITPHLEKLGYTAWNPYKEELNVGIGPSGLMELKKTDFNSFIKYCRKIVNFDLKALLNCDMVACLIDDSVLKGAGTYGELTMCAFYNIPVYAWIDLPRGKYDVPAWAMGCISEYSLTKNGFYNLIPTVNKNSHRTESS